MCNRYVQKGREVRPGQRTTVLMRGPGGYFEMPFDEAVFGGPARQESRNYWIKQEGAEPVLVPEVERFGEKDKATGAQHWATLSAPASMEGLLLPKPAGKDYRLLKVVTQPATPEQAQQLGNDRVPIFTPSGPDDGAPALTVESEAEPSPPPADQLQLPI